MSQADQDKVLFDNAEAVMTKYLAPGSGSTPPPLLPGTPDASTVLMAINRGRDVAAFLGTAVTALTYYATATNYATTPPAMPVEQDKGAQAAYALQVIQGA